MGLTTCFFYFARDSAHEQEKDHNEGSCRCPDSRALGFGAHSFCGCSCRLCGLFVSRSPCVRRPLNDSTKHRRPLRRILLEPALSAVGTVSHVHIELHLEWPGSLELSPGQLPAPSC